MNIINDTVYHGTNREAANNIITHGFKPSIKNNEWLGNGIYFFKDYISAEYWQRKYKSNGVVLQASIEVNKNEWFDLNNKNNLYKFGMFSKEYFRMCKSKHLPIPNFKNDEQRRCFLCNLYVASNNIKVLQFKFKDLQIDSFYGFPKFAPNTQICIFDNNIIKNIEEVDVNAL